MWTARLINPFMLYLAGAAVIPVIIHLLSRRRLRVVRFPAVRFLRRTARTSVTRANLKHLLLLLLRMMLIGLLALALARPVIGTGGAPADPAQGVEPGASAVIIVDDSLSMNYRRGHMSWFDQARSQALEVLGRLPADVDVALMTTSLPSVRFTTGRAALRARLAALRPTMGGGSCRAALEQAGEALRGRGTGRGVVYLLTDMTRSAWQGIAEGDSPAPGDPSVELGESVALEIIVAGEPGAANLAVTQVRHEGEPLLKGALLDLAVELLCVGEPAEEMVEFELDGRALSRRTVRLTPGVVERISLRAPVETAGHHWGRVGFLNADALPQDNARVFSFEAPPAVRVLCVEESAAGSTQQDQSKSYFLRAALNPWAAADRGIFRTRTVRPSDVEALDVGEFDLIALLAPSALDEGAWQRLRDFVAGGGGLLVAADDAGEVAPAAGALLPAHLGAVQDAPAPPADPMRIRVLERAHPFAAALEEAWADLGRAAFRRCRVLRPAEGAEQVLSFGPGLPALVFGHASGRVAVFAAGLDSAWGDLPMQAEFIPFCQDLALYLSGSGGGRMRRHLVGDHVAIRFAPASLPTTVTVIPPGAEEGERLMPGTTPGVRVFWKTQAPGYYRVRFSRRAEQWNGGFGVSTAPAESDLRQVSAAAVRAAVSAASVRVHQDTSALPSLGSGKSGDWSAFEAAPYLALLALAACLAELWLANRIYGSSPGPAAGSSVRGPMGPPGRLSRRRAGT